MHVEGNQVSLELPQRLISNFSPYSLLNSPIFTPVLNTSTIKWFQFASTCSPNISNRLKQACVSYDGLLYVHGGRQNRTGLRDLWVWNGVDDWRQLPLESSSCPPCLEGHTMVAFKRHLYIFGGTFGFPDDQDCPLWIYSIDFQLCRQWFPHCDVIVPQSRREHTAVVFDSAMHIFGGYIDLRGSTSELWTFDFASESWHLTWIATSKDDKSGPSSRHSHSAQIFDSSMWVYGGLNDLVFKSDLWKWNFRCNQWTKIKISRGPGSLAKHSSAVVQTQMLIMGGENGQSLEEIWSLDMKSLTWKQYNVTKPKPFLGAHQTLTVFTYKSQSNSSLSTLDPIPQYVNPDYKTGCVHSSVKPLPITNYLSSNNTYSVNTDNQLDFSVLQLNSDNLLVEDLETSFSSDKPITFFRSSTSDPPSIRDYPEVCFTNPTLSVSTINTLPDEPLTALSSGYHSETVTPSSHTMLVHIGSKNSHCNPFSRLCVWYIPL